MIFKIFKMLSSRMGDQNHLVVTMALLVMWKFHPKPMMSTMPMTRKLLKTDLTYTGYAFVIGQILTSFLRRTPI